jgi:hypothetical protein
MELINCHCGSKPKLKKRLIAYNTNYLYYECSKCEISTFGTRLEEFCRELWRATILKQKEMRDNK